MRRRRIIVFISLVALVCMAITTIFATHKEPSWDGRPLSSWLEEGYGGIGSHTGLDREAADTAVKNLGTDALPFLVRELGAEHSQAKSTLISIASRQSVFTVHYLDGEMRRIQAVGAFQALGKTVTPVLPQIRRYLSDPELQSDAQKAINAILAQAKPDEPEDN